jgi:integrase
MLSTGLQIDEALSLRRKDVNLDTLSVHVRGQGERDRLVRMSFAMGCVMSKWISAPRGNALVFAAPAGTNILQDLKDLGTSLGITGVEFSLRTLQNTYAAGIPGVRELCYDHDRFTVFGRMRDAGEG